MDIVCRDPALERARRDLVAKLEAQVLETLAARIGSDRGNDLIEILIHCNRAISWWRDPVYMAR